MFDGAYHRRLTSDLDGWERAGRVSPQAAAELRAALGPAPRGWSAASLMAVIGALLLAGALVSFVAANWNGIPRLTRLALLLALILAMFGAGAFARLRERDRLAEICVFLGTMAYGGAIALVGQMYHMPRDFAGGFAVWTFGALAAGLLTRSVSGLTCATIASVFWVAALTHEPGGLPHLAYLPVWLLLAAGAVWTGAPRLMALTLLAGAAGWMMAIPVSEAFGSRGIGIVWIIGFGLAVLATGLGFLLERRSGAIARFGEIMADYGFVGLGLAGLTVGYIEKVPSLMQVPLMAWLGLIPGAIAIAVVARSEPRSREAMLAGAAALLFIVLSLLLGSVLKPFGFMTASLVGGIALVMAGRESDRRTRRLAGWIALGGIILSILTILAPSLLGNAVFLGLAGAAVFAFALLLRRRRAAT
jgi:uncharacterized membrane protein